VYDDNDGQLKFQVRKSVELDVVPIGQTVERTIDLNIVVDEASMPKTVKLDLYDFDTEKKIDTAREVVNIPIS
jgi:hypothetical protein